LQLLGDAFRARQPQSVTSCGDTSILIPARGEEMTLPVTLPHVLREAACIPGSVEIVVIVPKGSTARSTAPSDARLRWVETELPGKFQAIRAGAREATGDILILMDADVEPGPGSFGTLLAQIEVERHDVTAGRIVIASTTVSAEPPLLEHWSAISAAAWHEFRSAEVQHRWALPGAMYGLRRELLPQRLIAPLVDDASIGLHAARAGARFGYAPLATATVRPPHTWHDWNRQKLRSRRGWHALSRHHTAEVESLRSAFRQYLRQAAAGAPTARLMRAQDRALCLVARLSSGCDDALAGAWEPRRRREQWATER
jgi:cellulose synthase/poly-beta-1,6-N-acetylglucosamine synthase-like glycosyltransferase